MNLAEVKAMMRKTTADTQIQTEEPERDFLSFAPTLVAEGVPDCSVGGRFATTGIRRR
jgi:hypothetical protein